MCEPSTELRKESKDDATASPALVRVMIVDDQQPFRAAARAVHGERTVQDGDGQ